ncbi:nuclear transport factor 2 family protein [Glaciibacter superstes]|uniref:nuclear transport factor 2 family protein n=1 Tax=Glaciibacter superstes TaxID=501023 RepID=UPI0003B52CAB|nr:nuclear transport factor 2 family protein [Glaciibacter superstes]
MNPNPADAAGILEPVNRLLAAVNAHDLDTLADCFVEEYVNETPVHPRRGFTGRAQVRANWAQLFSGIPDLHGTITGTAIDGDRVWSEWSLNGTRLDGSAHTMAGVVIFTVHGDVFTAARFFLEPVETGSGGVDDAVRRQAMGETEP